jgi:glycosyltransferase involved in cell wall biosynthesis
MSIRVAHLTGLWKAGAGAVVRIHEAVKASGVSSRLFSIGPFEQGMSDVFPLPEKQPKSPTRWRTLFARGHSDWNRRISRAGKANPDYEAFSPPVALRSFDLSEVVKDVDLLHLHWAGGFIDFGDFFDQVRVPVIWTLHDQNPYLGGFHYQSDVDAATSMLELEYECRDLKRKALQDLDLTVVGNSDWNTSLASTTGVLPKQTRYTRVYLPLPIEHYVALQKDYCKQLLGIDASRFVVGFACASMGNRRKGFVDLMAAIERLPSEIKSRLTLLSFGYEPGKEIRRRVSVPWVHCGRPHGGHEQSPIYSAMDLFVIPSLEEAFGQTGLEALACETPVVGTRVGGIPELVHHEETGLLVPARSPHLLSESIARLNDDTELRIACGKCGRRLARQRHASAVIGRAHVQLYEDALRSHSRSSFDGSVKVA